MGPLSRRSLRLRLVPLQVGILLAIGCKKVPIGQDALTAVDVRGLPRSSAAAITSGISSQPTPKLLRIFAGVYAPEIYSEEALEQDVSRIERELVRHGYYEARVVAVRVVREDDQHVRVEIDVDPGPQVTIGEVRTEGLAALPFDAAAHATQSIDLRLGAPFEERRYEQAKLDMANALADVGYAHVRVSGNARVDLATHSADVVLRAKPGPRATYGPVRVEGLREVPEGPVRSALQLEEGSIYSRKQLDEAQAALFRLGVFAQVEVIPELADGTTDVVPITVRVEEAALRSVTAGAGATLDVLRLAARGRVGWVHRNFLGGLRKFSVSTRPGLTFFPTRVDNIFEQVPTNVLPENSLSVGLEQPGFIEGRTKGFIETGYNVYPLLYPLPETVQPEDETVVGYNEVTARIGASRHFLSGRLPVSFSLNWRANFPFAYQGERAPGLGDVIVAYPELEIAYDLRDDPISPTSGIVLSNNLQVALPVAGSKITDFRIRPEVRTYVPLDFKRKLVLAARVTTGFLFTDTYGDALTGNTGAIDYSSPAVIQDQHTLLFRAFYSGGPSSNRGYPYQRIGPQGAIGFLVPAGTQCQGSPSSLPDACIRPLGGFTLWEASLELRYNIGGPWGLVAFLDTSDVGAKGEALSFTAPHLSVGPGIRYASPIGPIRVDVGFRVPGLQKLESAPDPLPDIAEVEPYASQEWWQAFALNILIGEAF